MLTAAAVLYILYLHAVVTIGQHVRIEYRSENGASVAGQLASVRDQGIVVLVRIRPKSDKEQGQNCFLQVQSPTQVRV